MTTLRERLLKERDRAANYYMTNGGTLPEHNHDPQDYQAAAWGFTRALELLMPVVQAMEEIAEGRIDVQNWEIQKARDAINELEAKLGDK